MEEIIALYKQGVDMTLIRENLRRTPAERVRGATENLRFFEAVRRAGRAAQGRR